MSNMFDIFNIMFIIVPLLSALIFIFVIAMIISPKLRGKFMSNQIKASKYMMDNSKEDLKSISDNMAYATKDSIKTTARAVKEGFSEEGIYCKYCGNKIDSDSKFCKNCGKKL